MLICLTASHKNADFDTLERLSTSGDDVAPRILAGHPTLAGAVVVSTCNRFEAYLDLDAPEGTSPVSAVHEAIRAVGSLVDVDHTALRTTFGFVHGNAVAGHLFSVAAGLESVVVGEGEIAGQVRRSLERARSAGTTTPDLERLFQRASRTSRTIKNETGIGGIGRSLVRLSLELASSRVPDWSQARVLLVGTGRYAGASLAALRDRGASDIRVYSPSGRAAAFARSHEIDAVSHDGYAIAAASADVIVACTTVDTHVVDRTLLEGGRTGIAEAHHTHSPALAEFRSWCPVPSAAEQARQLLIDLGLPRNIAPDVTEIPGVELLDLETIRRHAPLEELGATEAARDLVARAARDFGTTGDEIDLAPAIVALREHFGVVLDTEIGRARAAAPDLAAADHAEASLRHMTAVLLHTPMVRSRELARDNASREWVAGLDALFGVETASSSSARLPR